MNWYMQPLKKYAAFNGRARRREYWTFMIINDIIVFLLSLFEGIAGIAPNTDYSVLAIIFSLFVLIPSLAVSVRRLHDVGRNGLWLLIVFIPVIGVVALLIFYLLDSQAETNDYGPSPKATSSLSNNY